VSGNGISWTTCKSALCSRQIAMPAPHHSVFYRLDALPAAQPTVSKHWRCKALIPYHTYIQIYIVPKIVRRIWGTENIVPSPQVNNDEHAPLSECCVIAGRWVVTCWGLSVSSSADAAITWYRRPGDVTVALWHHRQDVLIVSTVTSSTAYS